MPDIWIPFWMNTIERTPHVSVGDVSPCSVGATRWLNFRSVVLRRNMANEAPPNPAASIEVIAFPPVEWALLVQLQRSTPRATRQSGSTGSGQAASAARIIFARSILRLRLCQQQNAGVEISVIDHGVFE